MTVHLKRLSAWAFAVIIGALTAAWLAAAPIPASAAEPAKPAAASTSSTPAPASLGKDISADVHLEEMELADIAAELGVRFRAAMASLPQLPGEFSNAVAREVPGDGDGWLGRAALSAVLAIAIGYAAARLFEHYVQKAAKPAPQTAEGFDTNTRIAFLLRRLLVWVIGSAILVGVGFLVLELLDKGVPIERRTALIPLVCVGIARSLLSVFRTLFTPALPQYRLVHVDTQQARGFTATSRSSSSPRLRSRASIGGSRFFRFRPRIGASSRSRCRSCSSF
ncbi:hypothetical protein [Segnochrobactrum spirostomi]|uniref:Mechanosensitive ion channel family protein n=1 Tax=Segnochrobactrum spirostomi TaxID=2608987 RepID=A0A6A7Y4D2_9HYPH|nr:hypothetical protein [Segnochrobactrum spirostomi]MQT13990.1 hypothetical protein [Segnochrobactrum spirostomi]